MARPDTTSRPERAEPSAEDQMPSIDFDVPADLFWAKTRRRILGKGAIGHRRFESLAEAIRYTKEDASFDRYGASLDTDDGSYSMDEVDALYESEDFRSYRDPGTVIETPAAHIVDAPSAASTKRDLP
ncbi:hypothetical protein [Aurantimonas sp. VKM B-3413]|uniref:hypothetical protein n=1 Tax=Aurantimonas sp. VKM B-3413 TaxID=2779401 RepID=UPI001E56829E|nr:hypothetical protein [Aurantimonas sp. VKM B-3413]MCB8837971.1 hypothetical protein [Aurantimonas sp. VKM B-3413]